MNVASDRLNKIQKITLHVEFVENPNCLHVSEKIVMFCSFDVFFENPFPSLLQPHCCFVLFWFTDIKILEQLSTDVGFYLFACSCGWRRNGSITTLAGINLSKTYFLSEKIRNDSMNLSRWSILCCWESFRFPIEFGFLLKKDETCL